MRVNERNGNKMNGLAKLFLSDGTLLFGLTNFLQISAVTGLALLFIALAGTHRAALRHTISICALITVLLSPVLGLCMRHFDVSLIQFQVAETVEHTALNTPASVSYPLAAVAGFDGDVSSMPESRVRNLSSFSAARGLSKAKPFVQLPSILVGIWLVGVVLMFLRLIYGLGFQYACCRKGIVFDIDQLDRISRRLRLAFPDESRLPQIVSSRLVDSPLAVGVLRQWIILPEALLEGFDEEELCDVLIHECSHVLHGDLVVGFFQRIAAILFWPHPLLHMLNRRLARAREEICDNHVLNVRPASRYAQTLLNMTALDTGECRIPGTAGLQGFNWKLEDRIKGILDERRTTMTRIRNWKKVLVFSVFFTGTLTVSLLNVQGADETTEAQSQKMETQMDLVLLELVDRKSREIDELSEKLGIEVPPEFKEFIDLVKSGARLGELSAVKEKIEREVNQYLHSETARLHSPLWSGPMIDLLGASDIMKVMSAPMLSLYANSILDSIPSGSLYFGGTDPGRFAITAFDAAVDNNRLVIITQNALADGAYMKYLRVRYGDVLDLPSPKDANNIFKQLEKQAKNQDGIDIKDGKVHVEGVGNVMRINNKLSKIIVDRNKAAYEIYVEESYSIPWMYKYMEPHGLIMKMHREPVTLTDEIIQRDRLFWEELELQLQKSDVFRTDIMAQRTFSKSRTSIGMLYNSHGLFEEAEAAFRQAMALCPQNMECVARLAYMYAEKPGRLKDAQDLCAEFEIRNPGERARKLMKAIQDRTKPEVTK